MKKMWKTRRKTEGVSPVIATILMVAITVVLAAVLYVMVMGFGVTATPTVTFNTPVRSGPGEYRWTVFSVSKPDVKLTDVQIVCVPAAACDPVITPATIGQTTVGAGDYFDAHFTDLNVEYTITVKYIPTGNAMVVLHITPV